MALIQGYGSDVPYYDQWDAEGAVLLVPWTQGSLTPADFFVPHNEHRVAVTRLLNLTMTALNGQWDARLECVVNAAGRVALAAAFFLYFRSALGRLGRVTLLLVVTLLVAAPISWENALNAFASQQYLLVGFSLVAITGLATSPPFRAKWVAGALCAVLALFVMASGLLAAVAVVAVLVALHPPRRLWRGFGPTLILCAAVVAFGWSLQVPVPYHESLKAHSLADLVGTFWRCLQWPLRGVPPFALLSFLPWAWLSLRLIRSRDAARSREVVLCGAGIWVLLQYAATAYARGNGSPWPEPRYFDLESVGVMLNATALLLLASRLRPSGRWRPALAGIAMALWGIGVTIGLGKAVEHAVSQDLPWVRAHNRAIEDSVRTYLATGDPDVFTTQNLPYPRKDILLERLSHPGLRALLPASVRPAIPITGTAAPSGSFVAGGTSPSVPSLKARASWGSFGIAARGVATWTSDPLPGSSVGYWCIPLAGPASRAPGAVTLQSLDRRALATATVGGGGEHEPAGWRTAFVHAPTEPAVLVATDRPPGWLAFGAPVAMAVGSYWAMRVSSAGELLIGIGAACWAALVLASVFAVIRSGRL